jgi:hypothetical protein
VTATGDATAATSWRVTAASLRGSSHRDAWPNQDAVGCELVHDGNDRPVWMAAVSDGHGGARYVRSEIGSRIAIEVALGHLREVLAREQGLEDPVELLRREVPAVVEAWRAAVAEHVAAHPFSSEEAVRANTPRPADHSVIAYGATLIVALVGEDGVGVAQVGDGDVLIRTHGFATRPVPGDPRLVAGETTSLCLDTAVADFRYASLPGLADPDLVLLATDGYGNSFADAGWWHELVDDLAEFVTSHGFDTFEERFPTWLGESALVGGDDVSAVVLARDPLVVPVEARNVTAVPPPPGPEVLPSPPEPPRSQTLPQAPVLPSAAPAPPPRRRRRWWLATVVACVLVALVATAGFLLSGEDQPLLDPNDDVSDSPTTSTAPSPSAEPADKADGNDREQRGGKGDDRGWQIEPNPPPADLPQTATS